MPSTRELRRRLKSVRSTRQITKAMELVSSSKLRRATQAALASQPYAKTSLAILGDILANTTGEASHPLLEQRTVKKVAIIVISSNRGLAGTYNSAMYKLAAHYAKEQQALGREVQFITIGSRVESLLVRTKFSVIQSYPLPSSTTTTADVLPIANAVCSGYSTSDFDQVSIIYTRFVSALINETVTHQLLPVQVEESTHAREISYEPSAETVLSTLLPRLVEIEIFQALSDAIAAEHSARRLAMQNATDNASDVIDDLTLTYNSIRQSAITQELAEITSGAASVG